MASDLIACPKCSHKFAPAESIQKEIRAKLEAEYEVKQQELAEASKRELKNTLSKARDEAAASAREEGAAAVRDLESRLAASSTRLKAAQDAELTLRKAQLKLEDEKAAFELEMTRKLDSERAKIKEEVGERVAGEYALKQSDWEKQRGDMAKQIEELRRKAEQGSQQTQGEVLELRIEEELKDTFGNDELVPVAKGVRGGDIQQRVQTSGGIYAGSILWELKRTKNWSDGWTQKIKDDLREAKADIPVIVTAVLPAGVRHIGFVDGVWVCDFQSYLGVAGLLRAGLLEVTKARAASAGRKDKATALYDYVCGNEFRGRVELVVEAFVEMQDDLAAEKRALEKSWAKREKQTSRAISGLAGLYGDMQGQIGSLPEIKALALEAN